MRWFVADPATRSGTTIPDMANNDNVIDPTDITNRAICKALGYPKDGTGALLARGKAGSVFWLECPDDLWASVSPHLTSAETASVVTVEPTSYVRNTDRARHSPRADRVNIFAFTDSIGWNAPGGTAGIDSYPMLGAEAAFGAMIPIYGGVATRERNNKTHTLMHYGNGGSRIGRVGGIDFKEEWNMQREVKHDTLPLQANDIIFIHLGANDVVAGAEAVDGAGLWSRLVVFLRGLVAAHPTITILVGTCIRRSEDSGTNANLIDYNTYLRTAYALEGVTTLVELEQAHADFSAVSGDTTGTMYVDAAHPSALGITYLTTAFSDVLTSSYPAPTSNTTVLTNGGFATDSDWTKGAGWTISGGKAVASTSEYQSLKQTGVTLTVGAVYLVYFTVSNYSSGSVRALFRGGTQVSGTEISANGTYSMEMTALSGNNEVWMQAQASGFVGDIDDFIVIEILAV